MAQRGRPIKLNDQVIVEEWSNELQANVEVSKRLGDVFVDLLKIGHDPEDVCDALDVDRSSYYNWRRLGMDAANKVASNEDYELTDNEHAYLDFLNASTRARGHLRRRLEKRIADLVETMEPREATDVLARLAKIKWAKASSMKLEVEGQVSIVEQHGPAVAQLLRLVIQGFIDAAPGPKARAAIEEHAPRIVQEAMRAVVSAPDPKAIEASRTLQ